MGVETGTGHHPVTTPPPSTPDQNLNTLPPFPARSRGWPVLVGGGRGLGSPFKQRVDGSSPSRPIGDKLAKFRRDDFGRDAAFGRRRAKVTTKVTTPLV